MVVFIPYKGGSVMAETDKARKTKSSINWPVLIASAICLAFISFVWVNNYRVSHAAPSSESITSTK